METKDEKMDSEIKNRRNQMEDDKDRRRCPSASDDAAVAVEE